ncbi:hypothetical protein [Burkholderia sp. WSM2232]|uniref:hypothetical protein n=1 Tax=Burkholderia sp. WSM2232 TaxID=944436 RepID=UPI0004804CA4|nr:hypothetical protein [Burkholderia sp. WSM2232]
MNLFRVAATAAAITAVTVLLSACSTAWPPPGDSTAYQRSTSTVEHRALAAQTPQYAAPKASRPALTVGVTDPNTQLILPWFLADTINAINTRQSFGDLLNRMKEDL